MCTEYINLFYLIKYIKLFFLLNLIYIFGRFFIENDTESNQLNIFQTF